MGAFQQALLQDLHALEQMLSSSLFEPDMVRIGSTGQMIHLSRRKVINDQAKISYSTASGDPGRRT